MSARLSSGALSQIIAGKRPLTAAMVPRVARAFRLTPPEEAELLHKVEVFHGEQAYTTLADDRVAMLKHWYYYAILSLGELKDSRWDAAWIAERLGLPRHQTTTAMARLTRLGVVRVEESGSFRQVSSSLTTTKDIPSALIKGWHAQILKLAQRALLQESVRDRDMSAIVFHADPARLPEAKDMIRSFRRQLAARFGSTEATRVYACSLQLFPLDRKEAHD